MLSVLCCLVLNASASAAPNPPHIIFYMADDAGWNDFGFTRGLYPESGSTKPLDYPHAITPSLDALAADGIKMMHHYAYRLVRHPSNPNRFDHTAVTTRRYCSPSRASFLTGRLPYHAHEGNPGIPVVGCTNLAYTMLPKKLAAAGYLSYQIGERSTLSAKSR
jgi:leishmanolysin-like peptidase